MVRMKHDPPGGAEQCPPPSGIVRWMPIPKSDKPASRASIGGCLLKFEQKGASWSVEPVDETACEDSFKNLRKLGRENKRYLLDHIKRSPELTETFETKKRSGSLETK